MKKIFTLFSFIIVPLLGFSDVSSLKVPEIQPYTPTFGFELGTRSDFSIEDVIYNPQGYAKPYTKELTGLDWGTEYSSEIATTIVFGEDDTVYICNMMGRELSLVYGSYVKGEIVGDEIHVPVPQTIVSYGTWGQVVTVREKGEDGEYYVSDLPYITYSYDKTTGEIRSQLPGKEGDYIIGLTWSFDGSWNEIGDFTQVYTAFDGEYNALPDGLALEELYYNDGVYGYPVKIGIQDDVMYFQGLALDGPEFVIKGQIEGDIVRIAQNQLIASSMGYFMWTKILLLDPVQELILAPESDTYDLYYDRDKKELRSVNPETYLALNGKYDTVFYFECFRNFTLKVQTSLAGTPSNPFWLRFDGEDYREYYGIYGFNFNISNISIEGNVLDINNIYYSIYVDGDILEFEEFEGIYNTIYPGIEGVMTKIPFTFTNGYDIDINSINGRFIGIYPDGVSTVGVQIFYIYDGVETHSNLLTLDVETNEVTGDSGVEQISIEESEISRVEYYTLDGRKISEPEKGLCIKHYILNNGKRISRKVMVR